jgi:hypothetical protein
MKQDSFTVNNIGSLLSAVVKSLERRWGITLVSFLSESAQHQIEQLQMKVAKLFGENPQESLRQGRHYIEFYEPHQLHSTHYTLTRSDPGGPVEIHSFLKTGHEVFELLHILRELTSQIGGIDAQLKQLTTRSNEFGIILTGECVGESSVKYRKILIDGLNSSLPQSFNITMRSWDSDSTRFHKIHTAIGYVKRIIPQGYSTFMDEIKSIQFDPISVNFSEVTLVHHKYRTLALPHEGCVVFPLGKPLEMTEKEFCQMLNLVS